MKYVSTRGGDAPVSFSESVLTGLARDGGLLLPQVIPDVSGRLDRWRRLPYPELAAEVMAPFVDLPRQDLDELVRRSYSAFRAPDVTPVVRAGDVWILELFHGPTLAFKDLALQFLGNLFEYLLTRSGAELNILGATSGDTGSAAIYGVRGRERIRIFVMHPRGRVSETQRLQMTTVPDANVFNLAVEGTFDDCQNIMKALFRDLEFKRRCALGSVNSINWARILAQLVYYFYAAFRVMDRTGSQHVAFSVPTGNFGDVFAGYLAARMGLPVSRLVLATNENDILCRFFNTGIYSLGGVHATISPSMDIQVASNFERYLYYRTGEDPAALRALMQQFAETGRLAAGPAGEGGVDPLFVSGSADTAGTLATIREFHARHGYLLDPHTAVGVGVGLRFRRKDEPLICLATAHPAKFGQAIRDATGGDLAHHPLLDGLRDLPSRCDVVPASADVVRRYVETRVG